MSEDAIQQSRMERAITKVCAEMQEMLLAKNKAYGNSVGKPIQCFSKLPPMERMGVRMDDKLSRMLRGGEYPGDDTPWDLAGYIILKRAIVLAEPEIKEIR